MHAGWQQREFRFSAQGRLPDAWRAHSHTCVCVALLPACLGYVHACVYMRLCFRGVFWDRKSGRWRSQLGHKNQKIFMGYFDRVEDAAAAYDKTAVKIHGRLGEWRTAVCLPRGLLSTCWALHATSRHVNCDSKLAQIPALSAPACCVAGSKPGSDSFTLRV